MKQATNPNIFEKCPECGNDSVCEENNYCTICGYDLDPHKINLKCCGRRILIMHDAYRFCPYCGSPDPVPHPAV